MITARFQINGIERVRDLLRNLTLSQEQLAKLHARYAIRGLQWVDDNFRQEGALTGTRWRPLSDNTVAARRQGSRTILQNNGGLRQSFVKTSDSTQATVGSALQVAQWQHEGTKGPYPIVAKNARALAFVVAGAGIKVKSSFSSTVTKRTYIKGTNLLITQKVMHPGLVARPMLPDENNQEFIDDLIQTTENFIEEMQK